MDEETDENILYGTPLPDIDDDVVLKKRKAKELQVFDEKGRQRFHGAFTGGFSAGYFNTVGTKEGWEPSTFVSSRNKSADHVKQKPEDFMDDEDFGEFGIATRKITATSDFQDAPPKKLKLDKNDDIIPGEAPLFEIVRPVRESVGIKILKKLGWTKGQGIGSKFRNEVTSKKVYGCSMYPEDCELNVQEKNHLKLFSPTSEDAESIFYQSKDNVFGLGYKGLSKKSVLGESSITTSTKFWLPKDKKKLSIRGQAFGVGAFEEEDADIYGKDDMSQYDFSEIEDLQSSDNKKPSTSKKQLYDGVIDGFRLGSTYFGTKRYEPPPIPPNFRVRLKAAESSMESSHQKASRHVLSASERSLLLGEKEIKKTVTESIKGRCEIKRQFSASSSKVFSSSSKFKPFENDPSKQERYEEYLNFSKIGELEKFVQPSSMTEWEKEQELQEFGRASMLFQPMSTALSSRFESRSHLSVEHEIMSALEKSKQEEKKEKPVTRCLIGVKNRQVHDWIPQSLLCKRFNVPNPFPNAQNASDVSKSKSIFSHLSFPGDESYEKDKAPDVVADSKTPSNDVEVPSIVPTSSTEKNTSVETNDAPPPNVKPPIDFFKDIFENSSSDEEEEDKKDDSTPMKTAVSQDSDQQTISRPIDSVTNNTDRTESVNTVKNNPNPEEPKRTNKVGFGVFANIDLDSLKIPKPPSHSSVNITLNFKTIENNDSSQNPTVDIKPGETSSVVPQLDTYGPDIPPEFASTLPSNEYKKESVKPSKHKSKHKHKSHKHKKSKKKKKRHSSDSDSLSELEDIPPSMIIEKLKKLKKKS